MEPEVEEMLVKVLRQSAFLIALTMAASFGLRKMLPVMLPVQVPGWIMPWIAIVVSAFLVIFFGAGTIPVRIFIGVFVWLSAMGAWSFGDDRVVKPIIKKLGEGGWLE